MSYCDLDDLINQHGEESLTQLTDHNRDGTPNPEVVDLAIEKATGEINAHLGTRHQLPLTHVPALLKGMAVDMAWYHLMGDSPTEGSRLRYQDALKTLQGVAKGAVTLGLEPPKKPPATQGFSALSRPPVVSSMVKGYVI